MDDKFYTGLTAAEVEDRINLGLVNKNIEIKSKSINKIIKDNTLTLFNIINLVLGLAVILVSSYKNLLFLGIVIINTVIGIVSEIYAKKTVEKLNLLKNNKIKVVRNKKIEETEIDNIVIDDLLIIEKGDQVACDSIIIKGKCEINEAFITGESLPVLKQEGDNILSGSFVVAGKIQVKVVNVGEDNFINKITNEAKKIIKPKSVLMTSLKKIIKFMSFIIIPAGILLFIKQYNLPNNNLQNSVINTVAALIGMIPDGLILLTTSVLAISVIRLGKFKVLVQELFSIESLARVDVLCLDKTGTLTTGKVKLIDEIIIANQYDIKEILSEIAFNMESDDIKNAIIDKYYDSFKYNVINKIDFSSEKKWSGITFENKGTYILGAPEFILDDYSEIRELLNKYNKKYRILLLAHSNYPMNNDLPKNLNPVALLLFKDTIRKEAIKTLEYFTEQEIGIKIISGDSIETIISVASEVGLPISNNYVDLSKVKDEELKDYALKCDYFGRTSPIQKKKIVEILKSEGFTVGFVGDGVNDVLALKESDCSIALYSGSDAASKVSKIVLLDSNFHAMPQILMEGRRTINNITRSATLFITKTIYATLLTLIFMIIDKVYPFVPIQFTLTSIFTIGIPSFILSLEPNNKKVEGDFLTSVVSKSFAPAMTIVINIIIIMIFSNLFKIGKAETSTLSVLITGYIGFMLLFKLSKPFNIVRTLLFFAVVTGFSVGVIGLRTLFSLTILTPKIIIYIIVLVIIATINFKMLDGLYSYLKYKIDWRKIWKIH